MTVPSYKVNSTVYLILHGFVLLLLALDILLHVTCFCVCLCWKCLVGLENIYCPCQHGNDAHMHVWSLLFVSVFVFDSVCTRR